MGKFISEQASGVSQGTLHLHQGDNLLRFTTKRLVLALIISCIVVFFVCQHITENRKNHRVAIAVTTATVVNKTMPFVLTFPAQVEPVQSVEVRSQVSGILQRIDFTPGNVVKAGQPLFQIVPDSFVFALSQAKSALARDEAQLANLQANEARSRALLKGSFISEQDYAQIKAQLEMQQAVVKIDQDKIENAALQLSYTTIQAPIAGKTGNVVVKVGDLIALDATNPLVLINKINPVYIRFYLPQDQLRAVITHKKRNPLSVQAWTEDGKTQLGQGNLVFIDNTVNTNTGTVLLKGLIPNQQHVLWPSQLLVAKLTLFVDHNALVIPSTAINMDETGPFVYKIVNHQASATRVTIRWQAGPLTVIQQGGLQPGDPIISVAPPNLEDGNAVTSMSSPRRAHEH